MELNTDTQSQVENTFSADQAFDDAFSKMASAFENGSDSEVNDVDNSQSSADDSHGDEQLQQSDASPVENSVENDLDSSKAASTSAIDYKHLYDQLQQNYNAQTGLLHSRIADLSEKYQTLKQTAPIETPKDETMEVVEEFKELYPDMYKAVEVLLKKQEDKHNKIVNELVTKSVQPIRQHLEESTQHTFAQRVSSVHPDVYKLIDSGALRQWASTLDPVRQAGANMIMTAGNADQVVQLISDYKKSVGTQQTQQPNASAQQKVALDSREEEIAKRVAQLIGVSSKAPGMSVLNTENKPNVPEDYDTLLANSMNEWSKRNKR